MLRLSFEIVAKITTGIHTRKMKHTTLTSGSRMPCLGLGTWQATNEEIETAVTTALENGYRHIDTAFNYNNEEAIGNALKRWMDSGKGKREDLFITTKLPHIGNRAKDVERFLKMSMSRLQLNYIDLYLIHMPFAFVCDEATLTPAIDPTGDIVLDLDTDHIETWKVMEKMVENGLVKNIGLSNFNKDQLMNVYKESKIKPAALQVELHAYLQQVELRKVCKELGMVITAFSPLGSPGAKTHFKNKYNYIPDEFPDILGHPVVTKLATKYNKTPAQILLRHLTQNDVIVIPKSANQKRIKENINIFDIELSIEDVNELNNLDRGEAGRIFNFFFFKGVAKHPQYPFKK